MNTSYVSPIRLGGLAAMVGGVRLMVHAAGVASMPRWWVGNAECASRPMRETGIFELFFLLALPLILAGMAGLALRTRQTGSFGRFGWTGVVAGVVGAAVLVGAILVQAGLFGGDSSLMPFFVIPGGLALIIGFSLVGIAVLRARVLPGWTSALLVASTVAMVGFNDQNAWVLLEVPFALAWAAAGYILWSGGRDPARRPAPARWG